MMKEKFPDGKYLDVPGLCRVAALSEIEAQGWSLNPGRYVGVAEREADDFDFKERLKNLMRSLRFSMSRRGNWKGALPRMLRSCWKLEKKP